LNDRGTLAQVNETRARIFLAQGRYRDAEKAASDSAAQHEQGDEQALLAEALVTQGRALARMRDWQAAESVFRRAAETAEAAGGRESAGKIYLTMIDELREFLPAEQMLKCYAEADGRMGNVLDPEIVGLFRSCARLLIASGATSRKVYRKEGDNLLDAVDAYEGELIKEALSEAKGSVTRAAKALGLRHQSLGYIIGARHKDLLAERKPVRKRGKGKEAQRETR
jgi:hypothetical protein